MQSRLDKVQFKNKIQVIMPDEVLDKIKYLCTIISKVEWSGILLYETLGSIQDPKNMQVILKDIIPMHKGSSTYTEYSFTEKKRDQSGYADRHIDYCEEFEEALSWQIGHIHSHNNMNVFFSGTDMAELEENSPSHNFYLSLIVNNKLDFMAKIAFIATAETSNKTVFKALNENGEEYVIGDTILNARKEKLFIYDCDIQSSKETVKPLSFFHRAVGEILDAADSPKTFYNPNKNSFQQNKQSFGKKYPQNPLKPWENKVKSFPPTPKLNKKEEQFLIESDLAFIPQDIQDFGKALLNGGTAIEGSLDELIRDLYESKVTPFLLEQRVLDVVPPLFASMFEDIAEDSEKFIETVEYVIEFFEIFEEKYPILAGPIKGLNELINKFLEIEETEENGRTTI